MNYEELVNRGGIASSKDNLPIGLLFKREVEGKFVNSVKLRSDLVDDPMFISAVGKECQTNANLQNPHLLHFKQNDQDATLLDVEQGNFVSVEQLVINAPSTFASKKFIENLLEGILDATEYLHSKGIFHVCYAPQSVMLRRGDSSPLLLTHGGEYAHVVEVAKLYEGFEEYVAPEVMDGGAVDERCDIYSIGKFMEYVFGLASAPYEYVRVMKKATNKVPEDRYQSIADIRSALKAKRHTMQSLKMGIAAVVIALLFVGGYFYLLPDANTTEFVKAAPKEADSTLLDDGFNPETEFGPVGDSVGNLTPEKIRQMEIYQAKSESIFRKRFSVEAERILSTVYNKKHMGASEKIFIAGSSSMTEELGKAQVDIANEAGLDGTRSNAIASEVIEKITEQKKKELKHYGVQK